MPNSSSFTIVLCRYSHLHETAARVEHFLGAELRGELAAELNDAAEDPHGREIPPEQG